MRDGRDLAIDLETVLAVWPSWGKMSGSPSDTDTGPEMDGLKGRVSLAAATGPLV